MRVFVRQPCVRAAVSHLFEGKTRRERKHRIIPRLSASGRSFTIDHQCARAADGQCAESLTRRTHKNDVDGRPQNRDDTAASRGKRVAVVACFASLPLRSALRFVATTRFFTFHEYPPAILSSTLLVLSLSSSFSSSSSSTLSSIPPLVLFLSLYHRLLMSVCLSPEVPFWLVVTDHRMLRLFSRRRCVRALFERIRCRGDR